MEELTLEQQENTLEGILHAIQDRMEKEMNGTQEEKRNNLREIDKLRGAYRSLTEFWRMEKGWEVSLDEIEEAFGF